MSDQINNIFRRLMGIYGNRFTRMWDGLDVQDIKAQWASELAAYGDKKIQHALNHLPECMPPTLLEFKGLCNRAPEHYSPALPAPRADAAKVNAAVSAALQSAQKAQGGPRGWAHALRAREDAGERLTLFQRAAWREALGDQKPEVLIGSDANLDEMKANAARRIAEYQARQA